MKGKNPSFLFYGSRYGFFLLAAIFFLGAALQIILAGSAIFANPRYWVHPLTFARWFSLQDPILLFLLAGLGRMPRWAFIHVFLLLFGVLILYYFPLYVGLDRPAGALYPFLAVFLCLISLKLVIQTATFLLNKGEGNE